MSDTEDLSQLKTKVTTLEAEHKFMSQMVEEHSGTIKDIDSKVDQIKSRLDGWNGSIPTIRNTVEELKTECKTFFDNYYAAQLAKAEKEKDTIAKEVAEKAESKVKLAIIWTILSIAGAGLFKLLTKLILG